MGLRFCEDKGGDVVCMYCSTSGYAFGPTFDSVEEASAFVEFCGQVMPGGDPEDNRLTPGGHRRASSDPRSFTPKFMEIMHRRFIYESKFWEARREQEGSGK